ncbi:hypothetical protein ACL7TT_07525 [Microbulbifer sp. 2304DJ12-6]|uniref:hypothetical protein n=1 Tax=Microbulbifer sp. 2304DJ12-6 TaxID=3233340 RepID=UPI0039AF91D0
MSYQESSIYHLPDTPNANNTGATAVFDGSLYYLGNMNGNHAISESKGALVDLKSGDFGSLTQSREWQIKTIKTTKGTSFYTRHAISAVVSELYLYLLWIDNADNQTLKLSRKSKAEAIDGFQGTGEWCEPISFKYGKDTPDMLRSCCITRLPNQSLLIGWQEQDGKTMRFSEVDIEQQLNDGAQELTLSNPYTMTGGENEQKSTLGSQVTACGFLCLGKTYVATGQHEDNVAWITIFEHKGEELSDGDSAVINLDGGLRGVYAAVDPIGNPRFYYCRSNDKDVVFRKLILNDPETNGDLSNIVGTLTPETLVWNNPHSSQKMPLASFIVGSPYKEVDGKRQSVPENSPALESSDKDEYYYDIYENIFVVDDHIKGKYSTYGSLRRTDAAEIYNISDTTGTYGKSQYNISSLVVRALFDSPMPFPQSNTMDAPDADYARRSHGSIHYLSEKTSSREVQHAVMGEMGVHFLAKTTKGIGPYIDLQAGFGLSGKWSEAVSNQALDEIIHTTQTDYEGKVVPDGTVFCYGTVMVRNDVHMLDNNGKLDTNSPSIVSIVPRYTQAVDLDFTSYYVTPGDLTSYTENAINETMKQLEDQLNERIDARNQAIANGEYDPNQKGGPMAGILPPGMDEWPYAPWGSDYVGKVLRPNQVAPKNANIAWTEASEQVKTYTGKTTKGTEFGWDVYAKITAGASGGEEITFNGVGEGGYVEFTGSIGAKYEGSVNTVDVRGQVLQVDPLDVPAPIQDDDVSEYGFQVMILKPSKQWVDELWVFCDDPELQAKINTNSKPFRVAYLLSYGQCKNGKSIT